MAAPRLGARGWVGALAATALLMAGSPPSVAQAAGDLTAPLKRVPDAVSLVAVDGHALLARFNDAYRVSKDDGKTWAAAAFPCADTATDEDSGYCDGGVGRAAGGVVPLFGEDSVAVVWYSLTSNSQLAGSSRYSPGSSEGWSTCSSCSAGRYAVFSDDSSDSWRVVSSAGVVRTFDSKPRVLDDGSVVTRGTEIVGDDSVEVFTRTDLAGKTTELARTTIDQRLGAWSVSGSTVAYAISSNSDNYKLCVRAKAASASSCVSVVHEIDDLELLTDSAVIPSPWGNPPQLFPITAAGILQAPVNVKLPANSSMSVANAQGTGAPVYAVADEARSSLLKVNPNGSVTSLATVDATMVAPVTTLALTPTAVLGGYEVMGTGSRANMWTRSIGSALGAETSRGQAMTSGGSASAVASAGRWAVMRSGTTVELFDRDGASSRKITGLTDGGLIRLSGPYLLADSAVGTGDDEETVSQVWSPASGWKTQAAAMDIFGSLVLDLKRGDEVKTPDVVTVRDLTGQAASKSLSYKHTDDEEGAYDYYGNFLLWGDWVAADHQVSPDDWNPSTQVEVRNWRTGAVKSHAGSLVALGDGVAVISPARGSNDLVAWNFATGTETVLTKARDRFGGAVLDGSRVAYTTGSQVVVKSLAGVGRSAPRVLGVVAAASFTPTVGKSWTVGVDLTKPVAAGELQVRNAAGTVVRRVAVPASANGSLRGIGWDGRNDAGQPVVAGTYSFTLTSKATDGTGAVVAVDGTARALGSIKVTTFTAAPVPVVAGTWSSGQPVTATVGTWSPKPDSLVLQWLRDGKPISGATAASYKLGAADVGHSVSMRVTATKAGIGSVQATSAARSVAGVKFSKVGSVTLKGTAKVRKTLSAKVGKFSPRPAKVSYQWLRNGQPIVGAVKSKYKLTKVDKAAKVSVRITATKPGYNPVVKTSKAKKVK